MMAWKTISEHYSDDKSKMAVVSYDAVEDYFFVDYFSDVFLIETIKYPGKSQRWAEDCAENYVLGILNVSQDAQ